ncbi:MAG TPA: sterol carrier protein domain-containing protein, partial [Polyangiales bacterium]|nr:sterol carrier protein domain-containing protein [Polyangiales bacterium]
AFREQSIVLEVATADRKHRIALGSSASPSQTIALELSPGALAQLLFGYLPARTLLAAEGAALPSAPHAAILDALFEQPAPFVWHTDRF